MLLACPLSSSCIVCFVYFLLVFKPYAWVTVLYLAVRTSVALPFFTSFLDCIMAQPQPQPGRAPAANVHVPGAAAVGAPVPAPAGGAAAAAAPAAMVRPAVMPEAYSGTSDWAEYVQYLEQCALINGWGDPQKAQFLAVMRLRDAAQRFYNTLPVARKHNWQHVCQDMGQRFAPAATAPLFKAQFKARRRAAGEGLATLADELRRMVVKAYPNMPEGDRNELVRDQFIEALTPVSLRVRLQENPPATIQAAVEAALHLERVWGSVELPAGAANKPVGPYGEGAVAQLVAATASDAPPPGSSGMDRLVSEMKKLTARVDAICEQRGGVPPPRSGWSGRPGGRGSQLTCYACGRPGHRAAECSQRRSGVGRGRQLPSQGRGSQGPPRPPAGNGRPAGNGQ